MIVNVTTSLVCVTENNAIYAVSTVCVCINLWTMIIYPALGIQSVYLSRSPIPVNPLCYMVLVRSMSVFCKYWCLCVLNVLTLIQRMGQISRWHVCRAWNRTLDCSQNFQMYIDVNLCTSMSGHQLVNGNYHSDEMTHAIRYPLW